MLLYHFRELIDKLKIVTEESNQLFQLQNIKPLLPSMKSH